MPDSDVSCHGPAVTGGSRGSLFVLRLRTLCWRLRHDGMLPTVKRVASRLARPFASRLQKKPAPAPAPRKALKWEALNLQPGEWVEIKSGEEIRQTLDATGRCRGLGVMPEMWQLCGRRARVFKRVNSIVVESPNGSDVQAVRRMKHTVLLEGLNCDGVRLNCDRACFFFWRECWLRRVGGPAGDDGAK